MFAFTNLYSNIAFFIVGFGLFHAEIESNSFLKDHSRFNLKLLSFSFKLFCLNCIPIIAFCLVIWPIGHSPQERALLGLPNSPIASARFSKRNFHYETEMENDEAF